VKPPGGRPSRAGPWGANTAQVTRLIAIVGVQALAISGLGSLVPAYLHRAGAGDFLIGLAFTAWAITRGAVGLVSGRIYGRFGARRLLSLSLALFAATTLGYALDHAPEVLVALRLVQGVAAGAFWTALLATTANAAGPERRLQALTYVNIAFAGAGLLSNLLAGWLASAISPGSFFWVECGILGLVALPLALGLPPSEGPRGSARAGRAEAAAAAEPAPPPLGGRQRLQAVMSALAGLPVVITAVGTPVLLMRGGAGYRLVGVVAAAMVLANIVAQAPASRLARRWGEGRVLGALGIATGALLLLLPFAHRAWSVAALVIPLSGTLSLMALTWLSWAQAGVARSQVGPLTGLLRGVGDLSTVVAYTAFGIIAAHLAPSLWTLAVLEVATGLGALWLAGRANATPVL
jgi:predicted MFS family arabinose efflux permease